MRRATTTPPELPGFEYTKLLGSGGFADVFLYKQLLPRRDVAVKVLLVDEIDAEARRRFIAEANVMAQLSAHPYIVTIYHADLAGGRRPYFVMEYCPGPSLAERYKTRVLDVPDALRIGIRVGSAVAAAHAQGILHRDIKPANVLTNSFGWPALTDFGIASTFEGEVPSHTTSLGGRPGASGTESVGLSVPWSPPEMFQDDPDPDVRSDVFSLAATIHTVLAGRTPFELPGRSNGTLDIIGRIERGAITPIERGDVPRSLVAALTRGMSPRRADRFPTVVDFVRALQRVELELGYSPTGIDLPSLGVDRLLRPADDGGDETRVRPIATVDAQAPMPPIGAPPGGGTDEAAAEGPSSAGDPTRIRGVVPVAAPPDAAADGAQTMLRPRTVSPDEPVADAPAEVTGDEPQPSPAARRRRGLVIGIAGGIVALAVAAAIVLGVVLQPHTPTPKASGASGANPIPVQQVPNPKQGTVSWNAARTQATFTWSNPAPQKNDKYVWTLQSTNPSPTTTDDAKAVIDGVSPSSQVCIQVVILRAGRTSPQPLQECTS